ncbi:hypothetical protein Egran_03846 [Elaphomyces granulatus]|uniref:Protein LOT5 n=1 Tax=Elaphomyces granulatus TaxID=519963 RepID=A0A232LW62_9EURO|nr:hypothetical protein Egran_03846 [Elaphomyces granulatus]
MEVLHAPPVASSFTPLEEHQSRTPASFYSGPTVLHFHSDRCKVVISESELTASPILRAICKPISNGTTNGISHHVSGVATGSNGNIEQNSDLVIDGVNIWVTSEYAHRSPVYSTHHTSSLVWKGGWLTFLNCVLSKFFLYNPTTAHGVSIPYPLISLHAIQRLRLPGSTQDEEMQGLYLQLAIPSEEISEEDEEEECIALTIVPPPLVEGMETAALTVDEMAESGDKPEITTHALFAAVSACSNLHPDPANTGNAEDYEMNEQGSSLFQSGLIAAGCSDGGLPPPVDGSSRWITAENVHEFFDEEGDWIWEGEAPSASLGPGAGTVRSREVDNDGAGDCEGNEETKWRKTG